MLLTKDAAPARTALLLIAHGSRQPAANADLLHFVEQFRAERLYSIVEAAFLEMASPTLDEGGAHCVAGGAERVILLPFFLSAGVHVQRDLQEACRSLAEQYPRVQFRLAEPLGRHPLLGLIVAQRAREAERHFTERESSA
jgi:sirohydrochlorin ferrochelatase